VFAVPSVVVVVVFDDAVDVDAAGLPNTNWPVEPTNGVGVAIGFVVVVVVVVVVVNVVVVATVDDVDELAFAAAPNTNGFDDDDVVVDVGAVAVGLNVNAFAGTVAVVVLLVPPADEVAVDEVVVVAAVVVEDDDDDDDAGGALNANAFDESVVLPNVVDVAADDGAISELEKIDVGAANLRVARFVSCVQVRLFQKARN
jgi:hypothetical protein